MDALTKGQGILFIVIVYLPFDVCMWNITRCVSIHTCIHIYIYIIYIYIHIYIYICMLLSKRRYTNTPLDRKQAGYHRMTRKRVSRGQLPHLPTWYLAQVVPCPNGALSSWYLTQSIPCPSDCQNGTLPRLYLAHLRCGKTYLGKSPPRKERGQRPHGWEFGLEGLLLDKVVAKG